MRADLLSSSGSMFISDVLASARELLAGVGHPTVAYLPFAAVGYDFAAETTEAFGSFAHVETIHPTPADEPPAREALARADLIYLPGGNTYLLAKRLHASGLMAPIAARLREGASLVAFSAGTVACGPDVLTTNDANICGCRDFKGLGLLRLRLNVHYPGDGALREQRDETIADHLAFDDRPIVALEDGARLSVDDQGTTLTRGAAWLFERGRSPVPLTDGAFVK